MTEPKIPTQEVYAREAAYMQSLANHSDAFSKLLNTVPEDRIDLKETFQELCNFEPGRLLNGDKLAKLKEDRNSLYLEVSSIYKAFLREQLGLNEPKK